MNLTNELWQTTLPIYQKILEHPFNKELAEGTLSEKRFIFYMAQDSYYLVHFSRTLALIASRSTSASLIQKFLNFSLQAVCAERELHDKFLPPDYSLDKVNPPPSCLAYTHYLLATAATASFEEAVAAVLPCFWIYRELGSTLAKKCSKNNPYERWIKTYSSIEFCDATNEAINVLDNLTENCSADLLSKIKKAFEKSTIFEWYFWDDAYKMNCFMNFNQEII